MDPIKKLIDMTGVFAMLSLLAFGGGTAVLPEMKHQTVALNGWLTADQFTNIYSLGQIAPGPNMMMVTVIGYHVSGVAGAILAVVGFLGPSCLLTFGACRVWEHFRESPWRTAVERGMAPITIGLGLSGVYAIGRTASFNFDRPLNYNLITMAIGLAVTFTYLLRHINPALLILVGGVAGWLFLRV
jgi:chromate transporter